MLAIERQPGHSVVIGEDIKVSILSVRNGQRVKLGIDAPRSVPINREEIATTIEAFAAAGADLTFLEAPRTVEQMARYCEVTPGHKVANLVEDGRTPWLTPAELSDLGYSVALYPVSLLLHGTAATNDAARALLDGSSGPQRVAFDDLRDLVGWSDYDRALHRYEQEEA